MKVCSSCGANVSDETNECTKCGSTNIIQKESSTNNQQLQADNRITPITEVEAKSGSEGSIIWAFLGFFIPIVGLILWLAWKNTSPGDSRMAGKGLLIGIIFDCVVLYIQQMLS